MKPLILGCVLLLAVVTASGQRRTMPRGSFLMKPARTTAALLKQFDTNAEVRRRYMRIFGRSREDIRLMLSLLRPKKLTASNRYPVAYYTERGVWKYRMRVLPKGTDVFVTPEGKPFLKVECGNPIILAQALPAGRGLPTSPPIALPPSLEPGMPEIALLPTLPPEFPLAPPETEYVLPITSSPPVELAEVFVPEVGLPLTPEGGPEFLAPPSLPGGGGGFFWPALFPPFLLLLDDDDGGPPPAAIPESSTWIGLAGGCVFLLAVVRRGRRYVAA